MEEGDLNTRRWGAVFLLIGRRKEELAVGGLSKRAVSAQEMSTRQNKEKVIDNRDITNSRESREVFRCLET